MSSPSLFRAIARRAFGSAAPVVAALALLAPAIAVGSIARAAPAHGASSNSAAPMRFVRVRSAGSACGADCPEWISAEGKIVRGTADALDRVIAAQGDRRLPIFINSAGGSVDAAMAMGRLIRAKRLAVVVAHTEIAPCAAATTCGEARGAAVSWGAYCASACTLVLAGGVERYVSPLAFVGVHQLTELVTKTQVKRSYAVRYFSLAGLKLELSRRLVRERRSVATTKRAADRSVDDEVGDYLAEMGVLDPVMKLTLATPASDVHWLTAEELAASRLATIWVDGVSPIVEEAGAGGLRGQPIDARSGASLFLAEGAAPLERPIAGRPADLEASFAYRRGGAQVLVTLFARDAAGGKPVDARDAGMSVTLYPEGAEYRAQEPGAGEPARVAIPVRSFCRLRRGGRAVVSFAQAGSGMAGQPPGAIDPIAAKGAKSLFDEACPRNATASR